MQGAPKDVAIPLGRSCYFPFTDRDLVLGAAVDGSPVGHELITLFNLHLLFFHTLVIPDGASLYNPELRNLALHADRSVFDLEAALRRGDIVWSRRDVAETFAELHAYMQDSGSRHPDTSAASEEFVTFLDDVCAYRLPYDFQRTGSAFTELTEACLVDSNLTRLVGLERVAADALAFSDRQRTSSDDRFARRTAAYEFSLRLEARGRTRMARQLRHLSTAIYHGSAAEDVGLQPAFPHQFSDVVTAVYRSDVAVTSLVPRPRSLQLTTEYTETPLYFEAVRRLEPSVLAEIRRSQEFEQYLAAFDGPGKSQSAERGAARSEALRAYLDYLREPLAFGLDDATRERRQHKRRSAMVRWTSTTGTGVLLLGSVGEIMDPTGLPTLASLPAGLLTLAWGWGGSRLAERLRRGHETASNRTRTLVEEVGRPMRLSISSTPREAPEHPALRRA